VNGADWEGRTGGSRARENRIKGSRVYRYRRCIWTGVGWAQNKKEYGLGKKLTHIAKGLPREALREEVQDKGKVWDKMDVSPVFPGRGRWEFGMFKNTA